ncbi:uncharacterized protein LOC129569036 [Sitodiplosis mosellana]|uniref:uncharacterized protein LOC129569036 n=1 Tax=Sitodiplosis mosellana TaxID=263140 RepID=UPI002444C4A1|nr:uncharacterized protein LOC129569036 [Sitodiplosis mosellana]
MIWLAILLICPSISLAFNIPNTNLYGDSRDQSDLNHRGVPTTEIPDIDDGDDRCVGRIEMIRFSTGPQVGTVHHDITTIQLNSFTQPHRTEESLLRMPLYKAYKQQSTIRIDSPTCDQTDIEFKGFSIIAKGNKPKPFNARVSMQRQFNSNDRHNEKLSLYASNGTTYENCYGFIQYLRILQTDEQEPDAITVVKLHNEELTHYTLIPHHRELIMDAYFYGYEVQLLTNSCTDSDDRGFASFRIIRQDVP